MANPEHLAILKQGVKVWNEWRGKTPFIESDFSGADLGEMDLSNADLRGANLEESILRKANLRDANISARDLKNGYFCLANLNGADLFGADLTYARLGGANLTGVNLAKATIGDANLSGTDLRKANFSESNLRAADLRSAKLDDANFFHAVVGWCNFVRNDLSRVQGLETVSHSGPSSIGIDTIYSSAGKIPDVFLRGCGVPEDMIAYVRSLRGKVFEFYSCFISHSAKDTRFCERLYADLQAKGVRVWYFPEDAKWGETVWGEIDRGIKIYDKLIVVCSEDSLKSGPVNREIERSIVREDNEGKGILFPIRIDDYIFDTWEHERKADVLAKVVGDFSGWDKDAAKYDKAFDKLLKGLQAL